MAATTKQQAELKSASPYDTRKLTDSRARTYVGYRTVSAPFDSRTSRLSSRAYPVSKNMAALLRHAVFKTRIVPSKNVLSSPFATKAEKRKGIDRKPVPKIDSTAQSLAAKGFLRPQREYVPPQDVDEKLSSIFKSVVGDTKDSTRIADLNQKFNIFVQCEQQLNHNVPSSLLHLFNTLGDVRVFFKTPVDVRTPLDRLKDMNLPENLHVQYEYHRFHPDTDKLFNGVTAFPKSSTIVTGLKYKDKYPGHKQEDPLF
ncbi:unnamed protein product [Phyllotreta striolata]|uniref:Large ribosomal subunit protein mL50 n=1 Tax=Phyllotreta striolata TaxID=444603 RepID=A0A9N9XSY2_PHYSR|nr:unnamed protein product [Phyllotreta striolata]